MPCYMTGSQLGDAELALSEARAEATKLTRLLCAECERKEAAGETMSPKLAAWWAKHKKIDKERK